MFAHRSGLPGNAGNDLEAIGFDRTEILHRLRLVPPASSFRSAYAYSNFGITAGAVAAAAGAGFVWEEAADERLYEPLGMTSTSSRHSDFLTRPNRAALHIKVDGAWTPELTRDPDAQSPAGGVSSSARDLVKWLSLEVNNGKFDGRQLISEAALGATHEPVIMRGPNADHRAAGVLRPRLERRLRPARRRFDHAGAFSRGARTLVSILPGEKLGIVVLSNAFPSGRTGGDRRQLLRHRARRRRSRGTGSRRGTASTIRCSGRRRSRRWAPLSRRRRPTRRRRLPLSAYAGTYANGLCRRRGGDRGGRAARARPRARRSEALPAHPLRPRHLRLRVLAGGAGRMSSAVFAIGPDDKAAPAHPRRFRRPGRRFYRERRSERRSSPRSIDVAVACHISAAARVARLSSGSTDSRCRAAE